MTDTHKVAATNEILSAFLSADMGNDTGVLKASAGDYISQTYGVDLSAFDIKVVENTATEMHLSLPFYTGLEEVSAAVINDKSVSDVAGGEFGTGFMVLSIVGGCIIAGAAAVGIVGGAVGGARARRENK